VNFPNAITVARIAVCPVIFWLALSPSVTQRYAAFVFFVLAAFSDLWDGYIARKHGLITDLGKLLDPVADKLLLVSTFVPFYILAGGSDAGGQVPFLGGFPLWIIAVVFGRELFVTVFRGWATRRGVVIAAGTSGKYKTLTQNFFIGGLLLWYPLAQTGADAGWSGGAWAYWQSIHTVWIVVMLALAVVLTVYSMIDYLWSYRALVRGGS